MQQSARGEDQEYWRPVDYAAVRLLQVPLVRTACPSCGVDYSPAAHFCHVCGKPRQERPTSNRWAQLAQYLNFGVLRQRLGLSVLCMLCLMLGIAFLLVAALMPITFRSQLSWESQVLQLRCIEWLLGAAAVLLIGILVKSTES